MTTSERMPGGVRLAISSGSVIILPVGCLCGWLARAALKNAASFIACSGVISRVMTSSSNWLLYVQSEVTRLSGGGAACPTQDEGNGVRLQNSAYGSRTDQAVLELM